MHMDRKSLAEKSLSQAFPASNVGVRIIKQVTMVMNNLQKEAIKKFWEALDLLRKSEIIRSDVVFGDIGEFLCTEVFNGLCLVEEKTKEGFDAFYNEKKVQIKFSNSSDTKNIPLGTPTQYEELIVVLGQKSVHRNIDDLDADYLFYRYSSAEVEKHFKITSGYTLSKTKHFKKADKSFDINSITQSIN